ncbi:MAG: hypothetical protein ACI9UJ_001524 [bacterium]|jgi:hypothetical protein
MNTFDLLLKTRKNIAAIVEQLSLEQLNIVPVGLNNNILWNLGHIVVTQQLLNYRLSSLPMEVDPVYIDHFKKGSVAATYSQEILTSLKTKLFDLVEKTKRDYSAGLFKTFEAYPTSYGITLNNIEDALEFNNAHEALHLGYIMAIRRMISK